MIVNASRASYHFDAIDYFTSQLSSAPLPIFVGCASPNVRLVCNGSKTKTIMQQQTTSSFSDDHLSLSCVSWEKKKRTGYYLSWFKIRKNIGTISQLSAQGWCFDWVKNVLLSHWFLMTLVCLIHEKRHKEHPTMGKALENSEWK